MLIYIGTPMVNGGLCIRSEKEKIEPTLCHKVVMIGGMVPKTVIFNMMTNILLVREV